MGAKWSTVSTSTYADNSPSDDGTATAANRVKFATIKTDLTDPLDTAIDSIVAKLDQRFDETTTAVSTNYTTVASDHARIIEITSGAITLLAAATAGAGYRVGVYASGGARTVNRSGADTINGATSLVVQSGTITWFIVNAAGDGYVADKISNPASQCLVIAYMTNGTFAISEATTVMVGSGSSAYTEITDSGGDLNATTGVFTVPATGIYQVNFSTALAWTAVDTTYFYGYFGKSDGTTVDLIGNNATSDSTTINTVIQSVGGGLVSLNVGDTYGLWAWHENSGGTNRSLVGTTQGSTMLTISRVL